jgi:hypothetical protein
METGMILVLVIVIPLISGAVVLRWAPEGWLQAFVVMARSLGRSI